MQVSLLVFQARAFFIWNLCSFISISKVRLFKLQISNVPIFQSSIYKRKHKKNHSTSSTSAISGNTSTSQNQFWLLQQFILCRLMWPFQNIFKLKQYVPKPFKITIILHCLSAYLKIALPSQFQHLFSKMVYLKFI